MQNDDLFTLCNNRKFRERIEVLIPSIINKHFSSIQKKRLIEYINGIIFDDSQFETRNIETLWDLTLEGAKSEAWIIFFSRKESIGEIINETLNDIEEGMVTFSDLAQRLSTILVSQLANAIAEELRDTEYAGLREAITRIKENAVPVFATTVQKSSKKYGRGIGTMFAPALVKAGSKEYARDQMEKYLPEIAPVDSNIRKLKRVPIKDGDYVQKVWNWDVVKSEAQRFWQAFIEHTNKGKPVYVPLYAMYCWIRKSIPLGIVKKTSIDAIMDAVEGDNEEKRIPSEEHKILAFSGSMPIEEELFQQEIETMACDFAATLSPTERVVCIMLGESDATMKQMAKILGKAGPSSITDIKRAFYKKLRQFFSLHPEFREIDNGLVCVTKVIEACKKYPLAANI